MLPGRAGYCLDTAICWSPGQVHWLAATAAIMQPCYMANAEMQMLCLIPLCCADPAVI